MLAKMKLRCATTPRNPSPYRPWLKPCLQTPCAPWLPEPEAIGGPRLASGKTRLIARRLP